MNDKKDSGSGGHAGHSPGMGLSDIYYVLFRHKWKILCCSVAGLVAASFIYVFKPPLYTSAAKLYIRYVEETRLPNAVGNNHIELPDARGDNIMNSEVEILTSLDLAQEVVNAIGAEKILAKAGGGSDPNRAAAIIKMNISVDVPKRSDVLKIFFQHPDREIVQPVLTQLIASYLNKQAEIHRNLGVSGDFLTKQTAAVRSELANTEDELRKAKMKAGVVSLDDAKRNNAGRISKIRDDILIAEADLAEHQAVLKEFGQLAPATGPADTNTALEAPSEQINQYKGVLLRLDVLSRKEQELLTQFTENSTPVKDNRQQITDAEQLKKKLEAEYPKLASLAISTPRPDGLVARNSIDPSMEAIQAQALVSKIDFLNTQLAQAQAEQNRVEEMEATIVELQRKKELEENKYRYFSSSLEQACFDEALGAGKLSNISSAQTPSPPYRDLSQLQKQLAIVVLGGVLAGIALAFLLELYLDPTLKRPIEVETRLRLPLFISIPDTSRNGFRHRLAEGKGHPRLNAPGGQTGAGESDEAGQNGKMEIALWDTSHRLRPYFEALRDRLVVFFDANKLTHHPKLVAVMGCAKGAGVTTIAAGLAATLSETGEGNVLLVDMNNGQGAAHPFFKGKPACNLAGALENKDNAQVQENLYVVVEGMNGDKLPITVPRQFAGLMPKLRASEYDYIIFDMPPVSHIGVATKLGRFMDVNLMVIESEKTDREVVKQASSLVSGAKANVGVVLNRKRTYVPRWLQQEL
ncbi:MAG: Wzz/FepE/Etk N-terminal domain-containing protein [Verrucomicrobiia bacterium]